MVQGFGKVDIDVSLVDAGSFASHKFYGPKGTGFLFLRSGLPIQPIMQSKLNAISPELRQEPLVKDVSEQLSGIEKLVNFPEGKVPTADDVKKLNEAVSKLMTKIESKD